MLPRPAILLTFLASSLLAEEQRQDPKYWAYQEVKPTAVPELEDEFIRNPIDSFILEGLRKNDLSPNPPAAKRHLIRRVFYDTTGLPPTAEQLASDQKWEDRIEELLASPRFGEKMATYWLDLVRYAETNGFERDSIKPQIWRYRDYIVESFNQDKPYDRFLLEQLAGDELPHRLSLIHI